MEEYTNFSDTGEDMLRNHKQLQTACLNPLGQVLRYGLPNHRFQKALVSNQPVQLSEC